MNVPGIASFSSFIEVFVAANLAYAGSNTFRAFLSNDLMSLKKALNPRFSDRMEEVESIINILRADDPQKYASVCENYDRDGEAFRGVQSAVTADAEAKAKLFPLALKPVFLMSGLYGLLVLFVSGFCIEGNAINEHSLYLCVASSLFIVPWAIWRFIVSFNVQQVAKWPRPIGTIMLLVACSVVFPGIIWQCPLRDFFLSEHGEGLLFWMMIAAIASAYILYFLRAYIHKWHTRYLSIKHTLRHEEKIHELTKAMTIFVSAALLPKGTAIVYPKPKWHHYTFAWWRALGKYNATSIEDVFAAEEIK